MTLFADLFDIAGTDLFALGGGANLFDIPEPGDGELVMVLA